MFTFSAVESEWQQFLVAINKLVSERAGPAPRIFISYAWEASAEATEPLQQRLALLQRDLLAAGASEVFLDINQMDGDLVETMRRGVNAADVVLMICTPRYVARVQDARTNAAYEFNIALSKRAENPQAIIPLWWSGTLENALPEAVRGLVWHDFRDSWARAQQLGLGQGALLKRVFAFSAESQERMDRYWEQFRQDAFGADPLPSILTPLRAHYAAHVQRNELVAADLPALVPLTTEVPVAAPTAGVTFPVYLQTVITQAQGLPLAAGTPSALTSVLWQGDAPAERHVLRSVAAVLWATVDSHQVYPIYLSLPLTAAVRGDVVAQYLQQRIGYNEAEVLSLKQHYQFIILLDHYDALLGQQGLRNVLKEADTLHWPAATMVSGHVRERLQWRVTDTYLQRQGYAKATHWQLAEFTPEQVLRIEQAWGTVFVQDEPPLAPVADPTNAVVVHEFTPDLASTAGLTPPAGSTITQPTTPEAAWADFLQAVKVQQQLNSGVVPTPSKIFISVADQETDAVLSRVHTLQQDLLALGLQVWLDTSSASTAEVERTTILQQAGVFIAIATPRYQLQNQDKQSNVSQMLQQAQRQQKQQQTSLLPLWFAGPTFQSAVPSTLGGTLVRDMRDSWYYPHQMASLADPLGVIPALFNFKIGTSVAQAYAALYATFQSALPNTLAAQGPSLLNPLLRAWKAAASSEGAMRPRPGCYVWPDIITSRESEARSSLQSYWEQDILPRALGATTETSRYSAPVYYLLGDSGCGKSTVLWEFADKLWQNLHQQHIIPIRIGLSNLTQRTDFLHDFLTTECGYRPEQVQLLRQQYRFLFLLDAYDELVVSQGTRNLLQDSALLDWPGAIVITARISAEADLSVMNHYLSRQRQGLANRRYLCNFTAAQVDTYLQARAKLDPALTPPVIAKVDLIPGLKTLIANPLLLYLVTDILPELSDTQQRLTRYDLYERFSEKWFGREFSRMVEEGKLAIPSQLSMQFEQALITFAEEVAERMFVTRTLVVDPEQLSEQAAQVLSRVFQAQDTQDYLTPLRQASPLKPVGEQFQFMHKSFFEQLMARVLVGLARVSASQRLARAQQLLTHWPIQQEPQILHFLFDVWTNQPTLKTALRPLLLAMVQASQQHPEQGQAAANALTLLNWMGEQLGGLDFSDTHLPGVDLSKAILPLSSFDRANLQGAALCQTILYGASFEQADLRGVQMGELPWLTVDGVIGAVAYHPTEPWLAVAAYESIWLLDIATSKPPQALGWKLPLLTDNRSNIRCLAFSPDGTRLVSGQGNELYFWDMQTGTALDQPLTGHKRLVNSVAFSPDGMRIVSASMDETLRFWDVQTGAALGQPLVGHRDEINSVAFSPDGTRLVSGSSDKTLRLWHAQTGAALGRPLVGHKGRVHSVAFSPDGTKVVSGASDETLRLWDPNTAKALGEPLVGHKGYIVSAVFSPDGTKIASGGSDSTVRVWDTNTGGGLGQPLISGSADGSVQCIMFNPDGSELLAANGDGVIRRWAMQQTNTLLQQPLTAGHSGDVNNVLFSRDGRTVMSWSPGKILYFWDVLTGVGLRQTLNPHPGETSDVAFSGDGARVVSASYDKTLCVWNATTGTPLGQLLVGHTGGIICVALTADGSRVASGGYDKTVRFWDGSTGAPLGQWLLGTELSDRVTHLAFSPDGMRLAVASGNRLRLRDLETERLLIEHACSINCLAFSADGSLLASGYNQGPLQLWDARTGVALGQPLAAQSAFQCIIFSPDTAWMVSADYDTTICLWDLTNREEPVAVAEVMWPSRVRAMHFLPCVLQDESQTGDYYKYQFVMGDDGGQVSVWGIPAEDPRLYVVRASKSEKMRMAVFAINLDGCQLESQQRRLFDLYGADVSEVVECAHRVSVDNSQGTKPNAGQMTTSQQLPLVQVTQTEPVGPPTETGVAQQKQTLVLQPPVVTHNPTADRGVTTQAPVGEEVAPTPTIPESLATRLPALPTEKTPLAEFGFEAAESLPRPRQRCCNVL